MKAADLRLAELRASLGEITPEEALVAQGRGAVLLDVRETEEVAGGSPLGALRLSRGFLELRIEERLPNKSAPVRVICAGGSRSLFAGEALRLLGYSDVRSVAGGFNAWKQKGLPMEVPERLDAAARERYSRHILMPEVGEAGQLKLRRSRVCLLGAGGLGSPAAFYLAAAGVGFLRIIDDDVVDRSNLQRQILHTDARVGQPKVDSARATLNALNPEVSIEGLRERLRADNVERLLSGVELVIDGSDNFAARYLVNDACVKLKLPNVYGAIFRFEGQVSVFHPHYTKRRGPCYRCLYPEAPPPELAPSCAEAGVLGVLPGIVGCLQAVEAIKLLLGLGEPLVGKLLHYDALAQRFGELSLDPDPDCMVCGPKAKPIVYQDLGEVCAK